MSTVPTRPPNSNRKVFDIVLFIVFGVPGWLALPMIGFGLMWAASSTGEEARTLRLIVLLIATFLGLVAMATVFVRRLRGKDIGILGTVLLLAGLVASLWPLLYVTVVEPRNGESLWDFGSYLVSACFAWPVPAYVFSLIVGWQMRSETQYLPPNLPRR